MKKNNSVEEYIDKHKNWSTELDILRSLLQESGMIETIKWGAPVYTVDGKNVIGLGAFKSYVGIWFFNGVFLNDKHDKLQNAQEGKTKALRQWRFSSKEEIINDEKIIKNYVKEAIANQKAGKELKPEKSSAKMTIPEELQDALSKNNDFKEAFESFTPFKQKEFIEYIGSAKRSATRVSRLTKVTPMIFDGVGLNDKYRNC